MESIIGEEADSKKQNPGSKMEEAVFEQDLKITLDNSQQIEFTGKKERLTGCINLSSLENKS